MKKLMVLMLALVFSIGAVGLVLAADNPLEQNEKAVNKSFGELIPADKFINAEQFKKVYDEVMAGKKKAYIIDVRTIPEFYAFHIEGTNSIPSGLMYEIPKKITDPNAEIYIY